ncbi:unnamed protein product [Pneumocystis jirovecii]|uniref:Signal peptidase complex catalytic subunit SEC11 n=1 Tax=Pneumocystis jirovecii TaxID=42068 RepID=L0PFY9_PNEJI|nr:unnamed protein product [Pneumocystis jirovecii]
MLFQLKYSGLRQTLLQILNLIFHKKADSNSSTAYMIWKGLSVVTNCESPIVVVLSGSMEPAFQRGDILFLDNRQQRVNIGDIVVYRVKEHDIPIVHRVIQERHGHESQKVLTKGDNNRYDDLELYSKNQVYLDRENIIGVVKGFVPYVGWITLAMNDFPKLKYCFLGGMPSL